VATRTRPTHLSQSLLVCLKHRNGMFVVTHYDGLPFCNSMSTACCIAQGSGDNIDSLNSLSLFAHEPQEQMPMCHSCCLRETYRRLPVACHSEWLLLLIRHCVDIQSGLSACRVSTESALAVVGGQSWAAPSSTASYWWLWSEERSRRLSLPILFLTVPARAMSISSRVCSM